MSFYDIKRISYARLVNRIAMDRPYKDSGNAYPLGDRKYSDRHFRHEDDWSFTIWYADRELIDNKYGKSNDKQGHLAQNKDHYDNRMIGIVRPDNSFEFVTGTSQGENMLLSMALGGCLYHDKSKGGTVYKSDGVTHPVFKGLRINCDTDEAMTPYTVFLPRVKRRAANEVMEEYQEFINTFGVMIDSMDDRGVWEVFEDLYTHEAKGDKEMWRSLDISVVKRLIDEKKYVDAGCLFTMLSKTAHMRWRVEWHMLNDTHPNSKSLPHSWRSQAKKDATVNFRKMILTQHSGVFDFVELKAGGPLPASQWGLLVQSGGSPVVRL